MRRGWVERGCSSCLFPDGDAESVRALSRVPLVLRGSDMFFVRKRLCEVVAAVVTFSITMGVFLLLSRHVPVWTAAVTALLVFAASLWSGL